MKHFTATVAARRMLGPALWEMSLCVPGLSTWQPGQGCLVATPAYLRRPLFPACLAPESLSVLITASTDPATAWLITRAPGDPVDLAGPFGRGFAAAERGERWLVVAEAAVDIGPLRQQIEAAVATGAEVLVLSGASHAATVFPAMELPPAVEVRIATGDGSLGTRGVVTGLLDAAVPWADHIVAVGSRRLYLALQATLRRLRPTWAREKAQVLISDVPLVCGVGACGACAVHGRHGVSLVCQAGPVVALDDALDSEAIV